MAAGVVSSITESDFLSIPRAYPQPTLRPKLSTVSFTSLSTYSKFYIFNSGIRATPTILNRRATVCECDTNNFAQPSIPKFDGDYDYWSMLMENLLRSKEYWIVIENGKKEPTEQHGPSHTPSVAEIEMKLKDLKVKNYLFQSIDKSILKTILQKDTSKQIWDSMKIKYQGNVRVKRAQLQTLRRDFEILEMKMGESVNDYFSKVMLVANDMRNAGENMPDVKIVEKILRTLTEKFNYIVCSIEESKDIDKLSVDELQSSLLVHEQKFRKNNGDEQALKVTGGGILRGNGPDWDKNVNYAEFDEEMVLMTRVEGDNMAKEGIWFLDSGCSNHMTGDKKWFISLDESFEGTVKLGNNSKMHVKGKGNIRLQINNRTQVITEVYFVPELKSNLISIGQLQEKGLSISIEFGVCKIVHPVRGLIMETNMSSNRTFMCFASAPTPNFTDQACLQANNDVGKQVDPLEETKNRGQSTNESIKDEAQGSIGVQACWQTRAKKIKMELQTQFMPWHPR